MANPSQYLKNMVLFSSQHLVLVYLLMTLPKGYEFMISPWWFLPVNLQDATVYFHHAIPGHDILTQHQSDWKPGWKERNCSRSSTPQVCKPTLQIIIALWYCYFLTGLDFNLLLSLQDWLLFQALDSSNTERNYGTVYGPFFKGHKWSSIQLKSKHLFKM